jgi:vancomycin permeability regulator SanA
MVRAFVTMLLLALAAWALLVAAIHLYGRRDHARPADAIVVLGAAHYDGRPSPVLRARVDHAVDLYQRGVAPVLIMTGGTAPGDTVSEAVAARRYAVRSGVPESAIFVERSGRTTLASMGGAVRVMQARELDSAVLVSDPFHMLRLRFLAWRLGIDGYTSPTPTSPISRSPAQQRRHLVRESLSLPLAVLEAL